MKNNKAFKHHIKQLKMLKQICLSFAIITLTIFSYFLGGCAGNESALYLEIKDELMQLSNTDILGGKTISILGDSISTYMGYSNSDEVYLAENENEMLSKNAVYYSKVNFNDVNKTWWLQTINDVKMKLLVNNSYSGDTVTQHAQYRCVMLHDNTTNNNPNNKIINPDIIAVYLGINDFNGPGLVSEFKIAYETMISKMKLQYSNSDIYLFTLIPNKSKIDSNRLNEFNEIIRTIANNYCCNIVDLYNNSGITFNNCSKYMIDNIALHPNKNGMELITRCFEKELIKKYLNN